MWTRCCALAPFVVLVLGVTASAEEIRGVISKVDAKRGDVVIEGRGHRARGLVINFDVEKDTRILFGREEGDVSDLQPGEHVRLSYETRAGRRVATLIRVHGGRPKDAGVAETVATDPNTVTGGLIRVAVTDREIVVVSPAAKGEEEKETTIQVPEKVEITEGKKALKLDDLKEGERVAVKTEKKGGKLSAVSIRVGGAAATAPLTDRQARIERLRQLLKLADWLLQQRMEQDGERRP